MLSNAIGISQYVTVITSITITLILGIIVVLSGKRFNSRLLAYAAVSIGLSFALSFVKVYEMPYGGSVTIGSFVPLIIFAYIYGIKAGIFAGSIYGLLQFLAGPYFLTPVQFVLDYILAFVTISGAGLMALLIKDHRKALIASVPVVYVLRLIVHILAGFIFYSSMTMRAEVLPIFGDTALMTGFVYSTLYNSTYIIPDMLISMVIIILLTANKSFIRIIEIVSYNSKDNFTS